MEVSGVRCCNRRKQAHDSSGERERWTSACRAPSGQGRLATGTRSSSTAEVTYHLEVTRDIHTAALSACHIIRGQPIMGAQILDAALASPGSRCSGETLIQKQGHSFLGCTPCSCVRKLTPHGPTRRAALVVPGGSCGRALAPGLLHGGWGLGRPARLRILPRSAAQHQGGAMEQLPAGESASLARRRRSFACPWSVIRTLHQQPSEASTRAR